MKLCYYHIKLFKIVGNHSHTVILVTIVISLVHFARDDDLGTSFFLSLEYDEVVRAWIYNGLKLFDKLCHFGNIIYFPATIHESFMRFVCRAKALVISRLDLVKKFDPS